MSNGRAARGRPQTRHWGAEGACGSGTGARFPQRRRLRRDGVGYREATATGSAGPAGV